MSVGWIFLGIVTSIVVWALAEEWVSRKWITVPMIFTGVGYALSFPIGVAADEAVMSEVAQVVAEVTLVIVLFADASHVRFREMAAEYMLPLRMLVVGMPLTIGLGTVVVYAISPSGGWAVALLTAAVLTPTDAALGSSVVASKTLAERLTQTINVESGLNDGLALPFVLIGSVAASMAAGDQSGGLAQTVVLQVVLGPLAGIFVGGGIALAMNRSQEKGWSVETSQAIVFLASAFAAYLLAGVIGGNGFIAAFVAGAVFGNVYRHDVHFIREFMESQGQLATIAAFVIFGAILLPAGIAHIGLIPIVTAVLFLTVVRMLPIFVSLIGTKTSVKERLFLGWFGPRGLASILFALIVLDDAEFAGQQEFMACIVMTVFLSIILHGISASPLERYMSRERGEKSAV